MVRPNRYISVAESTGGLPPGKPGALVPSCTHLDMSARFNTSRRFWTANDLDCDDTAAVYARVV